MKKEKYLQIMTDPESAAVMTKLMSSALLGVIQADYDRAYPDAAQIALRYASAAFEELTNAEGLE